MDNERIKVIKKARGRPRVSTEVMSLIREEVQRHPEKLRKELASDLESKIRLKGMVPPTPQTLFKLISKSRNAKSSPEDYPWHLDAFEKCSVPADALPVILDIQRQIDKNLSIRQVKWLTRIYLVLKRRQFLKTNEYFYCLYCYLWATIYSDRENISEISKSFGTQVPFNTSDLDAGLSDDNPLSLPLKPFVWDLVSTGIFWLAGAGQNVVSKEEKEHFGILLAQKLEETLIGRNLGGSDSGKPEAGALWLIYVSQIIEAGRRGYLVSLSKDEIEALLLQLREETP